MKLKNKLLPLVGVATACAAVAPIALTSCTNDSIAGKDLTKWFTPTITRHEQDIVSRATAIKWYFGSQNEWVTDTTNIVEDMQWSTSMMLNIADSSQGTDVLKDEVLHVLDPEKAIEKNSNSSIQANAESEEKINVDIDYSYYNVKLNSISFGTTYDYSETTQHPTLSYSIDYEYAYDSSANANIVTSTSGTSEAYWHYKGTFTVSNLPVTLAYEDIFFGEDDNIFVVVSDQRLIEEQKRNSGFVTKFSLYDSYSFDGNITTTSKSMTNVETRSGTNVLSYNQGSDEDKLFPYLRYCPVRFASYYLYSVGCDDWEA